MKISIAMATFNGERFLREQLASLAAQTRLPDELVVSDDGSSDETLAIVREFADTAPFPVSIHQNKKNLGYADNFLKAASACRGDWIAFCDQDDKWLPNKLSTVEQYFEVPGYNVVLVVHNALVVDEFMVESGVRYPNIRRTRVCSGSDLPMLWFAGGLTMVFRSELISRCSPRDRGPSHGSPGKPVAHDAWICWLACILGDVALLSEELVLYRRHSSTTTRRLKGSASQIRASQQLLRLVRDTLVGRNAAMYRNMSEAMLCHSAAFGCIGREQGEGSWRYKFLEAERCYRSQAVWLAERSAAYGDAGIAGRVRHLCRAVMMGGYAKFYGARRLLGFRALIKDLFASIVGGHALAGMFRRDEGN